MICLISAVAILKNSNTVGHEPQNISWYFLRMSGSEMTCTVGVNGRSAPSTWETISLGTRPFVRGRRKGSGHHLTFELSPGRNVDLTNQKRWLRMTSGKWFFSRPAFGPVTSHGESLCRTALPASDWQKSRRATSRSTVIVRVVSQLIANYHA